MMFPVTMAFATFIHHTRHNVKAFDVDQSKRQQDAG